MFLLLFWKNEFYELYHLGLHKETTYLMFSSVGGYCFPLWSTGLGSKIYSESDDTMYVCMYMCASYDDIEQKRALTLRKYSDCVNWVKVGGGTSHHQICPLVCQNVVKLPQWGW